METMEWESKDVVVVGGCGMIGTPLVKLLVDRRARVHVMDNMSRGTNMVPGAVYYLGDAGRLDLCRVAMEGAFAVFNLAASVAGLMYNQGHHAEMFEFNMRLLTAPALVAAECGVPHYLQTSSVCVYAPENQMPCREDLGHVGEPHPGNAGYAWAKRMGERVLSWAGLQRAVIVRPQNAYGPLDYFDARAHVIPALIRKCIEQDEIVVNGSGKEQREFIYSEDVARGMLAAMEYGRHLEAYTLGTHGATCISIRRLVTLIQELTGTTHKTAIYNDNDGGDPIRWSDATKAFSELNWKPEVMLQEGLEKAVKDFDRWKKYESSRNSG